ncbi:MAG: hypothetical protein ACU0GG_12590 [Paracoccaceae bacterium]
MSDAPALHKVPEIEKAPEHLRRLIKRIVHPEHPIAIGYLIDVPSTAKPLLIIGRSPATYLLFRRVIELRSLPRLRRKVILLWVDTIDHLPDPLPLSELLLAKDGFEGVHCLSFYPSLDQKRYKRRCHATYFNCLKRIARQLAPKERA